MRLSIKVADTMALSSFLQDANRNNRAMPVMICFKVKVWIYIRLKHFFRLEASLLIVQFYAVLNEVLYHQVK